MRDGNLNLQKEEIEIKEDKKLLRKIIKESKEYTKRNRNYKYYNFSVSEIEMFNLFKVDFFDVIKNEILDLKTGENSYSIELDELGSIYLKFYKKTISKKIMVVTFEQTITVNFDLKEVISRAKGSFLLREKLPLSLKKDLEIYDLKYYNFFEKIQKGNKEMRKKKFFHFIFMIEKKKLALMP